MSDTPSAAAQVLAQLVSEHHASRRQLEASGLSREQVRRALRTLSPALVVRTDAQGRQWYALADIPAAKRIVASRRRGPRPILADSCAEWMEGEGWRRTRTIAQSIYEPTEAVRRALSRDPERFQRRMIGGHLAWRLRDDGRVTDG